MRRVHFLAALACAFLAIFGTASVQQVRLPPSITQGPTPTDRVPVTSGDDVQKQQVQAANAQRLIEIRRDTDRMLELTQELKQYLAKTDQGVMSVDALKKAEQIEKLAKSVKSKMKQSF
ncbi:MAG TPA: hypothetical protein VGS27_11465 [Candidatus Sulfotelmatobacter sp.]|nr:hypothetical protein [Candidatus Sulfotelmatobacter sp.]